MKGIIGKKLGMTSIFGTDGRETPVTIIEAGPCVVTQKKTLETDGYNALQIGFADKKESRILRSEQGHFSKANTSVKKHIREIRDCELDKNVGDTIDVAIFTEGDVVSVIGTSKGKGFQGVVKRHGFHGVGESTHGQKDRERHPGSIGASSTPSRVLKGMKMGGQMGNKRVKVRGLEIVKIFPEKNYLLISGSVPGYNGSIVLIER